MTAAYRRPVEGGREWLCDVHWHQTSDGQSLLIAFVHSLASDAPPAWTFDTE